MNSGPSPSRAAVDDGADTQGLRKKLLPTLKASWRTGVKLAEGNEKASAPVTVAVVLPPDNTSRESNFAASGLQPVIDSGNKSDNEKINILLNVLRKVNYSPALFSSVMPNTAAAASIALVCAVSASMEFFTSALPAVLPEAIS